MTQVPLQDDLLAIDVDAEIRKLGGLRLRSVAEQVVELVRFACSQGAREVAIALRRKEFSIEAAGAAFDSALVALLVTAADSRLSQEQRHQAVVELERHGALGLLAAFAPGTVGVTLVWTGPQGGRRVELTTGRPPTVAPAAGSEALRLLVRGPRIGRSEYRAAIARACRFATLPIFLDGARVSRGLHLEDCLFTEEIFAGSSRAIIGLPWRGELCRIVRLRHGIQVEETLRTPQRGLLFHAVVDEQEEDEDVVEELRRASRQLYSDMSDAFDGFGQEAKRRAFELLIERSEKSGQERLLEDVAGFARLGGDPLTLRAIVGLSSRGTVYALGRGDDPRRFSSVGRVVLLVDDKQRQYLERQLETILPAPPPQSGGLTAPARLSARMAAWRMRKTKKTTPVRLRALTDAELSEEERTFRSRLSPIMARMGSLSSGRGSSVLRFVDSVAPPVQRVEAEGQGTWFLARRHPVIRVLMRGVATDDSLAYPALAALESLAQDGHEAVYDVLEEVAGNSAAQNWPR